MQIGLAASQHPGDGVPWRGVKAGFQHGGETLRDAAYSNRLEMTAMDDHQRTESGLAQGMRLLQDRVENRREVAARGIDDTQNLCGRGLLCERLVAFDRARRHQLLGFGKLPLEIGDDLLPVG